VIFNLVISYFLWHENIGFLEEKLRKTVSNSLFPKEMKIRQIFPIIVLVGRLSFSHLQHLLSKIQTECELEALNIGTRLADRYNSLDEDTEWDVRIHHDFLAKYLGFAGWIQMGLWKNTQLTAFRQSAPGLHKVESYCMFLFFLSLFRAVVGQDLTMYHNPLTGL
jgi:hypothetical protein